MTGPVAVVVPTWDGVDVLGACLDGLLAQHRRADLVVVVDNGSTDGSARLAAGHPVGAFVVGLPVNRGFAGGVNAGLRHCLRLTDLHAVALLNDDAVPDPGWLAGLVDELDRHPGAAAVACTMVRTDGRLDSTGELLSSWGIPFPRGRGEPDDGRYDDDRDVPAASGGASLFRAAALRGTGLFDEDFFAYYEDVDLCLRARLLGWQVRYRPDARVVHLVGRTADRAPGLRERHVLKNLVLLPARTYPRGLLRRAAPHVLLMFLRASVGYTRRGHGWAVLAAWSDLLRTLPRTLALRRSRLRALPADALLELLGPEPPPGSGR